MKTAATMSKDEAARTIQGIFRTRKAKVYIQSLLSMIMEKIFDEASGRYYYFNKRTGESSWSKPILMGSKDFPETVRAG